MLNKIGPETNPCGTPFKRADQELKDLSIFVLCLRSAYDYFSVSKRLLRIHKHIVLQSEFHD